MEGRACQDKGFVGFAKSHFKTIGTKRKTCGQPLCQEKRNLVYVKKVRSRPEYKARLLHYQNRHRAKLLMLKELKNWQGLKLPLDQADKLNMTYKISSFDKIIILIAFIVIFNALFGSKEVSTDPKNKRVVNSENTKKMNQVKD